MWQTALLAKTNQHPAGFGLPFFMRCQRKTSTLPVPGCSEVRKGVGLVTMVSWSSVVCIRLENSRLYPEGVIWFSPGSRSAPWVTATNDNGTPTGFHNSNPLSIHYLCNPFGVSLGVTSSTPGCAARPWAKSCNAYGVRTLAANPTVNDTVMAQQNGPRYLRGFRQTTPLPSARIRPATIPGFPGPIPSTAPVAFPPSPHRRRLSGRRRCSRRA